MGEQTHQLWRILTTGADSTTTQAPTAACREKEARLIIFPLNDSYDIPAKARPDGWKTDLRLQGAEEGNQRIFWVEGQVLHLDCGGDLTTV